MYDVIKYIWTLDEFKVVKYWLFKINCRAKLFVQDHCIFVVVVVYQCSISNVMIAGDIEALLYSKVHAVSGGRNETDPSESALIVFFLCVKAKFSDMAEEAERRMESETPPIFLRYRVTS